MSIDRQKLVEIVARISRDNPEFSEGLMKWVPLICSSVNKISWMTERSDEDVLQDILVGVSEINLIYNIPLYRYKGRLYEKLKKYGSLVLLKTPRNNKSKEARLWVESKSLKVVKKGKLESVIYREIFQQSVDILNSHFTQKNGYKKHENGQEVVVVRSGASGTSLQKKKVQGVKRVVELVGESEAESEVSWIQNPESSAIFSQYVDRIKASVSPTAANVLDTLILDPCAPVSMIAEYLDICKDDVYMSKCEIIRNLPFDSERIGKIGKTDRQPVYLSVR